MLSSISLMLFCDITDPKCKHLVILEEVKQLFKDAVVMSLQLEKTKEITADIPEKLLTIYDYSVGLFVLEKIERSNAERLAIHGEVNRRVFLETTRKLQNKIRAYIKFIDVGKGLFEGVYRDIFFLRREVKDL